MSEPRVELRVAYQHAIRGALASYNEAASRGDWGAAAMHALDAANAAACLSEEAVKVENYFAELRGITSQEVAP